MLKNIFENILNNFKNLEKITYKIMKNGISFCFGLCTISILMLLTYNHIFYSPNVYYIGLALFKLSAYLIVEFIVCGLIVDNIKKQKI